MEKNATDYIFLDPRRAFNEIILKDLDTGVFLQFNSYSSLFQMTLSKSTVIRGFLMELSDFESKFDQSMQRLLDSKQLEPEVLDCMKEYFINQLVQESCPQVYQQLESTLDSEMDIILGQMYKKLSLITEMFQIEEVSREKIKQEIQEQQEDLIQEFTKQFVDQTSEQLGLNDQGPWLTTLMKGRILIMREILINQAENYFLRIEKCVDKINVPQGEEVQLFKNLCTQTFKDQINSSKVGEGPSDEQYSNSKILMQIFIEVNNILRPSELKAFEQLVYDLSQKSEIFTQADLVQLEQFKHLEQSGEGQEINFSNRSIKLEYLKGNITGEKLESLAFFFKNLLHEDAPSTLSQKRKLIMNLISEYFPPIQSFVFVHALFNCKYESFAFHELSSTYDVLELFQRRQQESLTDINQYFDLTITKDFLDDLLFRSEQEQAKVKGQYELKLMKLNNVEKASHIVISISGFLSQGCSEEKEWSKLVTMSNDCGVQLYVLKWNSSHFQAFLIKLLKSARNIILFLSSGAADLFADYDQAIKKIQKILCILNQGKSLLEIFFESKSHAKLAGQMLGYFLASRQLFQYQSISLVGFSFGGQVIKSCLKTMHKLQAFNIIHNVTFLGAACKFKNVQKAEQIIANVVNGKVLNYYTPKDLILYLFVLAIQAIPIGLWPRVPDQEGNMEGLGDNEDKEEHTLYLSWKNIDVSEYMDIQAMLKATHFAYKSKLDDLFKEFLF